MPPIFFYFLAPLLGVGLILLVGILIGILIGRSNSSDTGSQREPEIPRRLKGDASKHD